MKTKSIPRKSTKSHIKLKDLKPSKDLKGGGTLQYSGGGGGAGKV
jgi:hypothetical protein